MSKCDLKIELEEPRRTYRPGEPIKGSVRVEVDANCECEGLTLARAWRTHGRGNVSSGEPATEVLHRGPWYAGETHRYPFEVPAPPGPFTYHGHYLNVDWYLTARADIPWALDPKAEEEFLLAPPAAPTSPTERAQPDQGPAADPQALFTKVGLVMGCVFGAVGLTVGAIGVTSALADGDLESWLMLPFGAVFALVGGGVAYMAIRNSLAERKLGPVRFAVQPARCVPGTALRVTLACSPRASGEILGITATLHGYERCVSGSGSNRRTHTHSLHERAISLCGGRSFSAGDDLALEGELRLPDDAPFSFESGSNDLIWSVSASIDIAGWPDWSSTCAVTVRP